MSTIRRRQQEKKTSNPVIRQIIGIEDMVLLSEVNDKNIVENLKERLQAKQIYTFIGHV